MQLKRQVASLQDKLTGATTELEKYKEWYMRARGVLDWLGNYGEGLGRWEAAGTGAVESQ